MALPRLSEEDYRVQEGDLLEMEVMFEFDAGVVRIKNGNKVLKICFRFVP